MKTQREVQAMRDGLEQRYLTSRYKWGEDPVQLEAEIATLSWVLGEDVSVALERLKRAKFQKVMGLVNSGQTLISLPERPGRGVSLTPEKGFSWMRLTRE